MKYSIPVHNIIAVASLLTLSCVQFFLLYNTYELKDDHYYAAEKKIITSEYLDAIRNDKVMPGGAKTLDRYITENMRSLEAAFNVNRASYRILGQKVCDSAFSQLKAADNIDSLLRVIIRRRGLNQKIRYATTIESLEIAFQHDQYFPLYHLGENYELIRPQLQSKDGIRLGGTLEHLYPNNLAKNVIVSSNTDYSYRISFSLYVDTYDRKITILRSMMPAFLLSLLSVAAVVLLYFITFTNWLRQKKLSEMKSDFINSITHEFHTPLSAIIVANRTMQNEKILSNKDSLLALTEVIQRQADRLKTLISQTLQITTMNEVTLRKEEHSVHQILDDLLRDYQLNPALSDLSLSFFRRAVRDVVPLDPFWFATIILNILDNAVKYNHQERKSIVVTTFNDRKALHIAIEDNGVGMARDVQKHIFEKFYRNSSGTHSQIKGLGLGLFYVKQAVESHRWKIDIKSVEGRGSIFTISIPMPL